MLPRVASFDELSLHCNRSSFLFFIVFDWTLLHVVSVSHSLFIIAWPFLLFTVILFSSMMQQQFRNSRFECVTQTPKVTYIELGLAELKHTCIGSPYDDILLGCRMVLSATAKHYAICACQFYSFVYVNLLVYRVSSFAVFCANLLVCLLFFG